MRILLDTHIWLWSLLEPAHLTRRARAELEDQSNELWLSPISTWEVLILAEKGRIVLNMEPRIWIETAFLQIPLREAPLTHEVAIQSRFIDLPHQDPADRFLAATAIVYDLTLLTADERLIDAARCSIFANQVKPGSLS